MDHVARYTTYNCYETHPHAVGHKKNTPDSVGMHQIRAKVLRRTQEDRQDMGKRSSEKNRLGLWLFFPAQPSSRPSRPVPHCEPACRTILAGCSEGVSLAKWKMVFHSTFWLLSEKEFLFLGSKAPDGTPTGTPMWKIAISYKEVVPSGELAWGVVEGRSGGFWRGSNRWTWPVPKCSTITRAWESAATSAA